MRVWGAAGGMRRGGVAERVCVEVFPGSGVGYHISSVFFFFFQAEDGIRDLIVTGVQTCALPISDSLARLAAHSFEWVLAGHGDRHQAPAAEMERRLRALVERMREPGREVEW